jgi:organic radical activating enzyme
MEEKKYYYSEIFHSIQGEGHYTGVPTAWIRFFLCNLQCSGFGQSDPTNPETYDLPFEDFDVSSVKRVEDLPVWEKGCDSSYTWAKKFKSLMGQETPSVLANKIVDIIKNESNPDGLFLHPVTGQRQHLCITGGEPLMLTGQMATVGIYEELERQNNLPESMTLKQMVHKNSENHLWNGLRELIQKYFLVVVLNCLQYQVRREKKQLSLR